MNEIIIVVGIPASGKSTWSRKQSGYFRINRDDLRAMCNIEYSKGHEKFIRYLEKHIASVVNGNIIIDDTNLGKKILMSWIEFARNEQLSFRIKLMETPIWLCRLRNGMRIRNRVPKRHMKQFIARYGFMKDYIKEHFNEYILD